MRVEAGAADLAALSSLDFVSESGSINVPQAVQQFAKQKSDFAQQIVQPPNVSAVAAVRSAKQKQVPAQHKPVLDLVFGATFLFQSSIVDWQ